MPETLLLKGLQPSRRNSPIFCFGKNSIKHVWHVNCWTCYLVRILRIFFIRAIWNQRSDTKESLSKLNILILILTLCHFEKFYQAGKDWKIDFNLLSLMVWERRWMAIIKLKFLRRVLVTAIAAWLTFWW